MDPPPAKDAVLTRGTMIGRYRLLEFCGRGGMGEVYLAEDTTLHRRVALKRVADRLGSAGKHRERILREARRASRLSDTGIAAVHDVLDHSGEIFLVMEYVEGTSLREHMKGPMPLEDFWEPALECAKALEAAHRQGIIHRDIKPENIMLTRTGQVKILDFGIARRSFAEEWETTTLLSPDDDRVAGTPTYMPPEAHLGRALDARADIFSLGVLFYELLAGKRPFVSETPSGLVNQILHEKPEPLDTLRPEVPEALAQLVTGMLAKDPGDRPGSTSQVLEGLLAARRGEPLPAQEGKRFPGQTGKVAGQKGESLPIKTGKPFPGQTRRPLAAGIVLAVAAVVLFAWLGGAERLRTALGLSGLPDSKNVAVLPFHTTGDEVNDAAFGLGLADALSTALSRDVRDPSLQVIPIGDVRDELGDEQVQRDGDIQKDVVSRMRAGLGANLLLFGDIHKDGDSLKVTLELLDPSSPRVLRRRELSTSLERFPRLVEETRLLLEIPPADSIPASVSFARRHRWGSFHLRGVGELLEASDEPGLERAIRDLDRAVTMDPDNPLVRAQLSRAYLRRHRQTRERTWLDQAVAAGRKAVQADPRSAEAQKALGLALVKAGQVEAARKSLGKAVALNPLDDEAVYELARSHGRNGDFAAEDSLFAAAVNRRPEYWRTHWWQATSFYKQGRIQEAIAPFQKTAELSPDYYKSYSNLGAIYLSLGRYEEAVEACKESVRRYPSYPAYSNLATALFYHRKFEQAAANYRKALEYDFEDYPGWMNLGDVYYWGFKQPEAAREAYRNAVEFGEKEYRDRPYDNVLLADLATIHPKLGEPDSARARIERALTRASSNPVVLYNAALTRWQLGDTSAALTHLEDAVAGGYPPQVINDSAVFDSWRKEPRFRALFSPPEAKAGLDSTRAKEVQHGDS